MNIKIIHFDINELLSLSIVSPNVEILYLHEDQKGQCHLITKPYMTTKFAGDTNPVTKETTGLVLMYTHATQRIIDLKKIKWCALKTICIDNVVYLFLNVERRGLYIFNTQNGMLLHYVKSKFVYVYKHNNGCLCIIASSFCHAAHCASFYNFSLVVRPRSVMMTEATIINATWHATCDKRPVNRTWRIVVGASHHLCSTLNF